MAQQFYFWDNCPQNIKTPSQKDICTPLLTAVLSTMAKIWNQPWCPTTDEWILKMWYINT